MMLFEAPFVYVLPTLTLVALVGLSIIPYVGTGDTGLYATGRRRHGLAATISYEVGCIRNVKPYCSNIALAVIERKYAR